MRSCDQLGVCRASQPPCSSCKPFAPGVITGGASSRPSRIRTALRWAWRAVSVVCVLIVLLGVIGLVSRGASPAAKVAPVASEKGWM